MCVLQVCYCFFSSRRRHTRLQGDWSRRVLFRSVYRGGATPRTVKARTQAFQGWLGERIDRKSGVKGKRVDLGGRRIIKKKKELSEWGYKSGVVRDVINESLKKHGSTSKE